MLLLHQAQPEGIRARSRELLQGENDIGSATCAGGSQPPHIELEEIQHYILENAMSPVHTWTYLLKGRYQPWVRNYYRHAPYGLLGMEETWLDK